MNAAAPHDETGQAGAMPPDAADAASPTTNDAPPSPAPPAHRPPTPRRAAPAGVWLAVAGVLLVGTALSLLLAWRAEQRVMSLEQELVRRQIDSAGQSAEAKLLAKRAEDGMLEMSAKVALLEGRVAEVAIQRGQLEDLLQSLSRSRDENVLVDIEAAIRVALQQNAITGSAEPLVATLRQSDERLARYNQPRLEGVRRAIARDLDRVRAVALTDIATLTIRLDDVVRMVDELPLLARTEPRKEATPAKAPPPPARADKDGAKAAAKDKTADDAAVRRLLQGWRQAWDDWWRAMWQEVSSLVRVTPVDHPDAMFVAPEQAYFFRENLKLRLLNARLSLLSRQFATAQSDLRILQSALERYFDRSAKRTQSALELVRQVSAQARQVGVPRPDDTLAALAAANAGR